LQTTIKRSDYGMTYGTPGIGDEIRIMIPVEALKDS
jgi:polyisoprenoid-binding protein YceI